MAKLRVHAFSVLLDGFGTGEGLTDDEPFGHAGERLHEWMFAALDGAPTAAPVDADLVARAWDGIGAEIMGRRKFHVGRGPLPPEWQGFWGDEPPFHTPVLVLGRGQRLWDGQEGLDQRFDVQVLPGGSGVTHLLLSRRRAR